MSKIIEKMEKTDGKLLLTADTSEREGRRSKVPFKNIYSARNSLILLQKMFKMEDKKGEQYKRVLVGRQIFFMSNEGVR